MQPKPTHEFGELSIVVVRKLPFLNQIEGSTKESRRHVRVFIDRSTNKPDEHKASHLRTSSKYLLRFERKLAAGEGVEPSSSSSKPDVLPVTPSRNKAGPKSQVKCPESLSIWGPWTFDAGHRLLVAAAGIEPTSLDYQSSALAVELHREV